MRISDWSSYVCSSDLVGKASDRDARGDFEDIVLLRNDLDILLQHRDRTGLFALVRPGRKQARRRRDLFHVARTGQRLANLVDPRSPATARFIGQDLVDVDEQARAAVIAVRDRRDGEPAENADAPRDREHEPAARPDAVQGHPEFIVEAVHRSKSILGRWGGGRRSISEHAFGDDDYIARLEQHVRLEDRKSTRLNSSK